MITPMIEDRLDRLIDALQRIEQWSRAYPLDIFPEPDLKAVAGILKSYGYTLDAVSASMARHVLDGVGKIAREALREPDDVIGRPDEEPQA
jgi:hypothetical protein